MTGVFPSPTFSAMDFPPELHEVLCLHTEVDIEQWKNDKTFDEVLYNIWERGLLDPPAVHFDFIEWWRESDPKKIIVEQCKNSLFAQWHRQNMGAQFIHACSQVCFCSPSSNVDFVATDHVPFTDSNWLKSRISVLWVTSTALIKPS